MATEIRDREQAAEELNELGALLTNAWHLAKKLRARGVDMAALGVDPDVLRAIRDAAENAYTLGKV